MPGDFYNSAKAAQTIEAVLRDFLNQAGVSDKLTVAMVKNWIWEEDDADPLKSLREYQRKILSYFETAKDVDLNTLFQIFQDAWNYFPHASLGGHSPMDIKNNYHR